MTGGTEKTHRAADIVDAEFETVSTPERATFVSPLRDTRGASVLKRGGHPGEGWLRPGGAAFWTGGVLAVCGAFWLAGGHALVARLPDLTPQPAPLRVAHFTSRVETGANGPLLTVDGELANDGRADAAVPPFSIDITTEDGATMRYFIADGDRTIRARSTYRFTSRLAVPARRIETVRITLDKPTTGGDA